MEDPRLALAGGVSMALGIILLDHWLFVEGTAPRDTDAIVSEISKMVMHGITSRPWNPRGRSGAIMGAPRRRGQRLRG